MAVYPLRLSDIRIYSDGSVQIVEQERAIPLIRNQLAIVSKLETYMADSLPIEVNAVQYNDQDIPTMRIKGHTIPVGSNWQNYLPRIQSAAAYRWVVQPRMLWINRDDWMAECIGAGFGNFIEILQTFGQWHEVRALAYDTPIDDLIRERITWRTHPTLIGKCTARRKDGTILNVGDGLDCYFPNMKRTRRIWIHDTDVELFPALPQGVQTYAVQGASVYGWTGSEYIPLRIAERPGQLEHPHPGWELNTPSVIPPTS